MAGKIYHSEEEYRAAILKRNETRKALSGVWVNLGAALIAAGAAQTYDDGALKPVVGGWFLVAGLLIWVGTVFLRSLEVES